MPGTRGGTGYPIALRCAKCRRSRRRVDATMVGKSILLLGTRAGFRLVATGRLKAMRHRGHRQTNRKIEYRCLDCGHIGWTQHIDAEQLLIDLYAPPPQAERL